MPLRFEFTGHATLLARQLVAKCLVLLNKQQIIPPNVFIHMQCWRCISANTTDGLRIPECALSKVGAVQKIIALIEQKIVALIEQCKLNVAPGGE